MPLVHQGGAAATTAPVTARQSSDILTAGPSLAAFGNDLQRQLSNAGVGSGGSGSVTTTSMRYTARLHASPVPFVLQFHMQFLLLVERVLLVERHARASLRDDEFLSAAAETDAAALSAMAVRAGYPASPLLVSPGTRAAGAAGASTFASASGLGGCDRHRLRRAGGHSMKRWRLHRAIQHELGRLISRCLTLCSRSLSAESSLYALALGETGTAAGPSVIQGPGGSTVADSLSPIMTRAPTLVPNPQIYPGSADPATRTGGTAPAALSAAALGIGGVMPKISVLSPPKPAPSPVRPMHGESRDGGGVSGHEAGHAAWMLFLERALVRIHRQDVTRNANGVSSSGGQSMSRVTSPTIATPGPGTPSAFPIGGGDSGGRRIAATASCTLCALEQVAAEARFFAQEAALWAMRHFPRDAIDGAAMAEALGPVRLVQLQRPDEVAARVAYWGYVDAAVSSAHQRGHSL
jgi:hypothetical protein